MKVLVTGATGYVGRYLCPVLINCGYQVTALTRKSCTISGVANYVSPDFSAIDFSKAMVGHDLVIHLAARAHQAISKYAASYLEFRKINVEKTIDLANAAIASGVKRFIYLSSIKVNGEVTFDEPFKASDPPCPKDFYGQTKWEAEQALMRLCKGSGMELVIIRSPLVWGGAVKGNLAVLAKLISYGVPLPFLGLKNRRDWVSLENLADLILCAIHHPAAPAQVLMVSDGLSHSTEEIIRIISSQLGLRPWLVAYPETFLGLCRYLPFIGSKLDKLIGNLEVDIDDTRRLLEWHPKSLFSQTSKYSQVSR